MSNIITQSRQPEDILAIPVGEDCLDEESKTSINNPQFLAILQQSREEKGKGGLSTEEMKQWMETELSQES